MRGHIRKRSKNSYSIVVSAGYGPDGKRKQVWRTVKGTRRDADKELTRLLRELDTGTLADPGRLSLTEYLEERWLPHKEGAVRPNTLVRYEQLLHAHVLPTLGGLRLAKLRPAHVQGVVDAVTREGGSARTALHVFRVFSSALKQAVAWQLLATNPAAAVKPPSPGRPKLRIPDTGELNVLLSAARGTPLEIPVVLAASTGLRRGEILGLRWREVDMDAGLARVVTTLQRQASGLEFVEPKTERSRRTVAIPESTVSVLRRHRTAQASRRLRLGELWADFDVVLDRGDGRPLDPGELSHGFAALAKRAGLADVRFHDLRHAFATLLLSKGIHPKIASEALGHSGIAITLDTYSHVIPGMQEEAARAVEEALGSALSTQR